MEHAHASKLFVKKSLEQSFHYDVNFQGSWSILFDLKDSVSNYDVFLIWARGKYEKCNSYEASFKETIGLQEENSKNKWFKIQAKQSVFNENYLLKKTAKKNID